MRLPHLDSIDHICQSALYQQQLTMLYQTIADNRYQQLTVLVDMNVYDNDILPLLPHHKQLIAATIKRIHHTFEHDLTVIQIALDSSHGQQILEQLLALAIYENDSDIAGSPHGRSIGLWLFDQPITEELKHSLYLMGQAYGLGSNKRRYLRYWDPRVFALLLDIWTPQQQGQVYQLGITQIHYLDWQGELAQVVLSKPITAIPHNEKTIRQSLPFRFSQQQWQLLEQVEWMNMIIRQLKGQIVVTEQVYEIIMGQASLIAKHQVTQQQTINNMVRSLEKMRGADHEQIT